MSDSGKKQAQLDNYFIPDLCRGQGLLGLLVVAGLMAVLMTLVRSGVSAFDFLFLGKVALEIFWIALLSALFLCQGRRFLIHLPLRRIAIINYLLILLAAAICALTAGLWRNYLLNGVWRVDVLWVINTVLIAAIPTGAALRLFYLQHRLRQQQQASQKSRIEALQSKIRPHFLFNSMNSLASLIRIDPDKAEQTSENLCDLFRYALNDRTEGVSLQLEVDACKKYLAIEKLRLAERLRSDWEIQLDLTRISVPALILQPLVENAVFHGIQPALKGGYLHIKIYRDAEWVCIDIVNSLGADGDQQFKKSSGHNLAVSNLRHRLDAFFNGQAELQETVKQNHYHTRMRFKPTEG
jgi:two-component system, LytTR family, sensor histidine kinase AlgZ